MTDDQPLDLSAVAADEAALQALRTGAGDDPALALLRDLLLDVERDLPAPVLAGTTVVSFAAAEPERRIARNGTVVAALTAGLLSLGGVAAASTLAPVDSPLHGLGEAVRSAAGAVVGAVTPPTSPGRSAAVVPTATASPTTAAVAVVVVPKQPTPGATVSAASRSRAAARQVDQLLDEAAALLKAGRTTAAVSRLDLAERKLADVLAVDRADLPQRLAALRTQATASPAPKATRTPKPAPAKADAPPPPPREAPRGSSRTGPPEDKPAAEPRTDKVKGKALLGQLSSDASMKPRA